MRGPRCFSPVNWWFHGVDRDLEYKDWNTITGGRFMVTGKDAEDRCGDNDFRVMEK